jgi:predicted MFS family arabinose efflux permease
MRVAAAVLLLAILTPALNTFITATVLPSVVADIGGLALYAWGTIAYSVASIVGSAATSAIARRLGLRVGLVLASLVFVVGTVGCAAAPAMSAIVGARAVQGLGGGMLIGVVHAMIRELFPERLWPRMLATVSIAWGIAALSGPLVGGVLAELGLWRTAFWAMVPVVALTSTAAWRLLPRRSRVAGVREALPLGRLLLICTAVLSLAAVANAASLVARATRVAASIITLASALALDARAGARLFPSGMLSLRRPIGKCFWVIFLLAMAASPTGVFMPLLVQVLHGVSPASSGYFYAGQSLAWTAAAILTARLPYGAVRGAIVAGPALFTAGLVGLSTTIASGPIGAIALSIALVGFGIGTCWAHVGNVVLGSARKDEEEATAALIPSTQQFAIAFGSALSGIIASGAGLTREASPAVAAAAGRALYGGFAIAGLAALIVASRLRPASRPAR